MNNVIGKRIKEIRKVKGFTQEELADKLNISQSAFQRMEKGETNSWANYFSQICEILEITPEELLSDIDNNSFSSLDQVGGFAFQNVGTINTINSLSDKIIELYEERIKDLKQQIEDLKAKA